MGCGGFSFDDFVTHSLPQHQLDPGKKHPGESSMACQALDVCEVWLRQFMDLSGVLVAVYNLFVIS